MPEEQDLDAGTYRIDLEAVGFAGANLPQVLITVPDGWNSFFGRAVAKETAGSRSGAVFALGAIDTVYAHPCQWKEQPPIDPGSSVDGLATSLARQPLRNATQPTPVTVDGYSGQFVEWSAPSDIDFADCDEGYFESWVSPFGEHHAQYPGEVEHLWILDVEGLRLVLVANYQSATPQQDQTELMEIAESVEFVP